MFKNYFIIFQDNIIILQPNIQQKLFFSFFFFLFLFLFFFLFFPFFPPPSLSCLQNLVPAYKRRLQDCRHCRSLPSLAMPCLTLPCHALSCFALPCPTLLCPTLPFLALVCLALPTNYGLIFLVCCNRSPLLSRVI